MGVDDQVLQKNLDRKTDSNQGNSSDDRVAGLREAQTQDAANQADPPYDGTNLSSEDAAGTLAAAKQEAKRKGVANRAKQAVGQAVSSIALALAGLLRMAWGNLIQSFGLTLIWINVHVFGNMVFGNKIFCDLGQEWQMRAANSKVMTAGAKIEGEGEEQLKKSVGKSIGIFEKMGLGCLDLTCCLVIIIILSIFALLLEIVANPLGTTWEVIKIGFGWLWDKVSGVFTSRSG